MSAPLAPRTGGLHTTDANPSSSIPTNPTSGASEPTPLVSLGHTLSDISNIGTSIETALATMRQNAPNKQELSAAVHASTAGCQELLANTTQVSATTKACADELYKLLRGVHVHLRDRNVYGKRAQVKGKVNSIFGRPATPPPSTYHVEIQVAFDALKNSLLTSTPVAGDFTYPRSTPTAVAEANPQDNLARVPQGAIPANESPAKLPAEEMRPKHVVNTARKKDPRWNTASDTVEGGLRLLSSLTDFIPDPAGPIVKLMAGTALTIIETLHGMADNQEEAMNLGRYIGTLIQTVGRFLEPLDDGTGSSCDAETAEQLGLFLDTLTALETNLVEFRAQGRFKQGVSHKANKDDLATWKDTIYGAFTNLQIQLSLGSIRLLTKMNASHALQERDRLIGLLGDGDIGATEKAADAADLMCLPGTRTEVLDQIDQWIADPSSSRVFWISGVAGCGKSAVAATIAGRPRAIPTSTAIFYFVRGNQERNKRVICSLSRQLARFGHGSLEHFVLSSVKAQPDIATSHLTTQFQHLVVDPLNKLVPGSPPVILVVDALDEWDNHGAVSKLLELIKQAHVKLPPTVRFVLASRNEPHLVKFLESDSMKPLVTRYPLDAVLKSQAGLDIMRYIDERFMKICDESTIGAEEKPWPKPEDVDSLVMLSDGLFQWAATVMSYIGGLDPPDSLRQILKSPERYRGLDNLYQGVLEGSPKEEMDERVPRLLQAVLGAILTAPAPINATTIAYLCCEDISTLEETTRLIQRKILPRLASMFIIPKDPTQPITVSHKSVLDYLTNKDRCTDSRFYADLIVHNDRMLDTCFILMESNLKRDICGINDPSKLNEEVQHLVERHVSHGLRYLCQHWVAYLKAASDSASTEIRLRLGEFSRKHVLHWLEVMGLIGLTRELIPIARDVELWLSASPSLSPADEVTQRLWSDAQRFVAMFSDSISTAVAHIYVSALRFAPTETQLVKQFKTTVERGVQIKGGLTGQHWPPSAWIGRGHTKAVRGASFSPNGNTIISGSQDKTLRLWDAKTGAPKGGALEGHTDEVNCVSFSPDATTILSGSDDQTLRLWNAESGAQKGAALKGHTSTVQCASFSPDGTTILSGSSDNTLRLWDGEFGTQKGATLRGHTGSVLCASFSPDRRTIVSGSYDTSVRFWDLEACAQKGEALVGRGNFIGYASFSPDGRTLLYGSSRAPMRLWDAEAGAQRGGTLSLNVDKAWCASFSPDGKTILSGGSDGDVRLWDVESGAQKGDAWGGHKSGVYGATFSPDGKAIVAWSKANLRFRNVDCGALNTEPQNGHTRGVSCFVFSPDGETVISGSYDNTVRLWDAETGVLKGEPLRVEGMVSELLFSTDGFTLMAKTYDGSSQEWDFTQYVDTKSDATRRELVFKGSVSPEGWIFHRDIRWFWVPFSYADWLLCGHRLALRRERVVYIFDVSEIMYIVE